MPSRPVTEDAAQDGVSLASLNHDVAFHLRCAQEASFLAFVQRTGDYDLSPGQYSVLTIIRDNPGASQAALGEAMGRDRSTMTAMLRKLEAKGQIVRQRSATDGRIVQIYITDAGKAELRKLSWSAHAHDRLVDRIVGADKAKLIALLSKLTQALSDPAKLR